MYRRCSVVAAIGAAGALALATPGALAANSPNASCVGAGSSALDPGQRAPLAHFVNSLPGPGGQFVKSFAQQKGTAEECFPNGPPGP